MKFYFLEAPSIFFSRNIIHGETNNSGHVCEQISLIRLCVCVCVCGGGNSFSIFHPK